MRVAVYDSYKTQAEQVAQSERVALRHATLPKSRPSTRFMIEAKPSVQELDKQIRAFLDRQEAWYNRIENRGQNVIHAYACSMLDIIVDEINYVDEEGLTFDKRKTK